MLGRMRPVAQSFQQIPRVRATVRRRSVLFVVFPVVHARPRDSSPLGFPVAPRGHREQRGLEHVTFRRGRVVVERRDACAEMCLDVRHEFRGRRGSGVVDARCADEDDARHQRLVAHERPARGHADAVGARPRDELVDAVEFEPARELGFEFDRGGGAVAVDLA